MAETPASGILKSSDYPDFKCYKVVCECQDDDHAHDVCIEVEDGEVAVRIYTTTTSTYWSLNRWKQIWEILTKGHLKQQVALLLNEQQARNYSHALTKAVEDVKLYKDNQ